MVGMTFPLPIAIAAALCAPAFSAAPTEGERGRALSELHGSSKQFLDAIDGLTEAQWKFKPAPAQWSIEECAEHLALTEDVLFGFLTKQVMSKPADPSRKAEVKGKDQTVLTTIADRSGKAKAPESIQPKRTWTSRADLTRHFVESRNRTLDYIRTTSDDLRSHFASHPAVGLVDGYQWLLLISAHTVRHTAQIDEVKASPGYPK
jgi:hypothetical protein